jgi:glycosyltransferase involved in cell wall biosynthesis
MNDPIVTIVIPVHRRLDYLREALSSALAQTFGDFEIIVTDDGPSPEIAQLVVTFDDPRIRYRHNGRNLGIALNHLAAFQEARGRYIANLHDDDIWEPSFLATLVPPLEADPTLTVAFCEHDLIDASGRVRAEATASNSRIYRRSDLAPGRHQPFAEMAVVYEAIPMSMASVFRKSILDRAPYPSGIGGCYDHWLSYLATRDNRAVFYVPQHLTRYRVHARSGTFQRGWRNLSNAIFVRGRFLKDPALAPYFREIANSQGVCYGKLALCLIDLKAYRRAWIVEKRAFSLLQHPKNVAGLLKNSLFHFLSSFWK